MSSRLIGLIEAFAEGVAHYLMPTVRWVGHKDERFEALARGYPGLTHERDPSGEAADLVIFDRLPIDLIEPPGTFSAESAYLFCLEADASLPPWLPDALARHTALTLLDPSIETLLWHVKALLLVRDLSYAVGTAGFPELLSIDRDHRRAIAQLVNAVLERRSCVVTVPSDDYRTVLLEFLFGAMPERIAPVYVDAPRFDPAQLASDRFNVVSDGAISEADLSALIAGAVARDRRCPLMIVRTGDVREEPATTASPGMLELSLGGWSERDADAHLLSYWAAAWHSHRSGAMAYYSATSIKEIHGQSGHDPCAARKLFTASTPDEALPDDTLGKLLEVYQRLSMDSILDEAERQIMSTLRDHSPLMEAVSHAAGIPKTTYYNRARRLAKRASLIELLASARSS